MMKILSGSGYYKDVASLDKIKNEPGLKNEIASLLNHAERFAKGQIQFTKPWDLEKFYFTVEVDMEDNFWEQIPEHDAEWIYMTSRHTFFIDLALAYKLTGKKEFLDALITYWKNWLQNQQYTEQRFHTTWRILDSGIRLKNWLKTLELVGKDFPEDLLAAIEGKIQEHVEHLLNKMDPFLLISNFTELEFAGLIPAMDKLGMSYDKELDFLKQALELQILADGFQREQSFTYHNEVLRALQDLAYYFQHNQIKCPGFLTDAIDKMSDFTAKTMYYDGSQSNFGDSDLENVIEILSLSEVLLNKPFLPVSLKELTLDYCLYTGKTQLLNEEKPFAGSNLFPQSGLFILRDNINMNQVLFTNGPLGGGHGHQDNLHFEIVKGDERILVDSGRYSYEPKYHDRNHFKELSAHNTIKLDKKDITVELNEWDTSGVSTVEPITYTQKGDVEYIESSHLGYMKLKDPVFLKRKLIYTDQWLFVVDETFSKDEHIMESFFRFDQPRVSLDGNKGTYKLNEGEICFYNLTPSEWRVVSSDLSENYDQKRQSAQIIRTSKGISDAQIMAFDLSGKKRKIELLPVSYHEGGYPRNVAEAVRFEIGKGKLATLVIQHREPDRSRLMYIVEDRFVHGQLVYFTDDEYQMIR